MLFSWGYSVVVINAGASRSLAVNGVVNERISLVRVEESLVVVFVLTHGEIHIQRNNLDFSFFCCKRSKHRR